MQTGTEDLHGDVPANQGAQLPTVTLNVQPAPDPLGYQIDGAPGAVGYSVVEFWGYQGALNYSNSPVVAPGGGFYNQAIKDSFYIDVKSYNGKSHIWGNGFPADTPFFNGRFGQSNYHGGNIVAVNGSSCTLTAYANIPAYVNGGNCPYAIPRRVDASPLYAGPFYSGIPCASGNLGGQGAITIQRINPPPVVNTNPDTDDDTTYNYDTAIEEPIGTGDDQQWTPDLQNYTEQYNPVDYYPSGVLPIYGDPSPVTGYLYNFHTIGIWQADAKTQTPNYDTSGPRFLADMIDGSLAYWRLGTQEYGPKIAGFGIRGYNLASPSADGTILYTVPVYIPGPIEYFTDVSVEVSIDNNLPPPSLRLKHLTLLNPDPPIGSATIGYIDLSSPTLSQDIVNATVIFYAKPQKYIPGIQT